jgi:restriction endonuclease S subunit
VPEHWNTPPLYLRYEAVLGKMLDEKRLTRTHLLPYVRNVDVQWDRVNTEELPELDIAPDEFDRFTLKHGDLLICEGGEVGRTAIWLGELKQCAFQKAIHRLRPLNDNEDRRFFFHCMSFAASTGVFVAGGNPNTIPHLTGEKLRRYRFPTPPRDEQTQIASFLDRETAKIDELVGEQRRLIELLKEKRQAVISHAVTKGLNPTRPHEGFRHRMARRCAGALAESNTIASVIIPVPPIGEQKVILLFLEHETAKLDALTAEAERAIELLQERRTALISAAVTGKIDVRGLAATEVL